MFETDHLILDGPDRTDEGRHLCMLVAHNEINLITHTLTHYRSFGDVTFVAVDDRSDDGTTDVLRSADDVTLLRPKEGSTFRDHKRQWRSETLDLVSRGRWVLLPDVDEFLVWHDRANRSFDALTDSLDAEGAGALFSVMVDMYADRPIADHVLKPGDNPAYVFPYFDAANADPGSTWMEPAPRRFVEKWPSPPFLMLGGMRQRLFAPEEQRPTALKRAARRRFGFIGDHMNRVGPLGRMLTRAPKTAIPPYNLSKLPLVKWQKGMEVYSGVHAIRPGPRLSRERGVLLHYPLTRGREGLQYNIERGQHMAGSVYYKWIVDQAEASPMFHGSRAYANPSDLGAYLWPPSGGTAG